MPTEPVMFTETDAEGNEATYEITSESGDETIGDYVVTAVADSDKDGEVDMAALDTDNDGNADAAVADTDGDGTIDMVAADTDGDGLMDTAAADTDGDGEVVLSWTPGAGCVVEPIVIEPRFTG